MAGKVRNEVEGQAKVSGEESLESFYSSIVGILSAMQVAEPYAQLFATALTTASSKADAGSIEKYTAALKKFNDTLARTASLVKKGKLQANTAGFDESSLMAYVQGVVPMGNKGVASGLRRFSGAKQEIATLNQYKSSDKDGAEGFRQSMAKAESELGSAAKSLSESVKSALGGASGSYTERSLGRLNSLLVKLDKVLSFFPDEEKSPEAPARKPAGKRKGAPSGAGKTEIASSRKAAVKKTAQPARSAAEETPPAEETAQPEKPREKRRFVVDTRKKSGEGLLKKAEKARDGSKAIRQLADIESDIYKELSDTKDLNISSNFSALVDRKKNGAGSAEVARYAALLSKSVNQGVAVSPKKVERIHSLVNEWNVASRYNELRKEARMPSMAVSGINSVMPELKFLASPYGTDKMAVSDSKIPELEKQIKKINGDNRLKPETRIERIREAIDSAYTMQTKGTADLMEIAADAQKQADEAARQAEKNSQEIEKIKAQKPAEKAPAETAAQTETAGRQTAAAEMLKAAPAEHEMDDFRSRWGRIVQENAASLPQETEAAQTFGNASINVTNGYFDIARLASALGGKDSGGKTVELSGKEVYNALVKPSGVTHTEDATFGNRALTLTEKGELILGRKDDILAWINDPTNVLQFIQAALGKKITQGSRSGEVLSSNDIYKGLSDAAKEAFGAGGHFGFIDREQIQETRRKANQKYDSETVNKIWGDRAYASGTAADILASRNLLSDSQKKNILASLLNSKGELDYDRVGIVKSLTYSGRKEGWDKKHREQDSYRSMSESMAFSSLNKKMAANGFSQSQMDFVNSFRGGEYGKQLASQVYSLILDDIKGELSKRNSGWALEDAKRKAMRSGMTSFTDGLGNTVPIDKAGVGDIDYIKRSVKLKPQQEIESLASSMDDDFARKAIESHIDKYIGSLYKYDSRYLGRKERAEDLKSWAVPSQRQNVLDSEQKLSAALREKISGLLTSGLSDKKVLSELEKLRNGGIEKSFKDLFDGIDKRIHAALDDADDFLERQKKAENGGEDSRDAGKKDGGLDRDRPFGSVYGSEMYRNNLAEIKRLDDVNRLLGARKEGASEEDAKRLESEMKKNSDRTEALRKQNKMLETQAKNLADEQRRTRVTFGRSILESAKAGLYRWNQNAQARGGIAGAFAKFGAQRMEGGSLQKLLGVNVGGIIGLAFAEGGKKIVQAVERGIKESLADFGNVQTIQTNLGTVYGSQSAADMRFADIANYATKSPFGVQQTSDFAVLLKQSGVYENDLMRTLSMIGDVAGGNQEKYSRIANNYAQIVAASKATAMDLRQFANAGIPIYKAIKDYLGSLDREKYGSLDTAAVRKMTQNGEITSDVIEGVFRMLTAEGGSFYNSVQRGAKTYKAQMQNMQDIRQLAGASVGEWVFGIGRNDGGIALDKESRSLFQSILDVEESIYGAVKDKMGTRNLKDKDKTARRDAERKKTIEAAIEFYKNNPELDTNGEGLKYFQQLLKDFTSTYDYAEIRSYRTQLYDMSKGKIKDIPSIEEVNNKRQNKLNLENKNSEILIQASMLNTQSSEYKKLIDELDSNTDLINQYARNLNEIKGGYATIEEALKETAKDNKEFQEKVLPYIYFKNQTLAEAAMSTAYGIAAKAESRNTGSAQSISSLIDEQYRNTGEYKAEQQKKTDEALQKAWEIDRWQKENNVTASNMFGFIGSEKSVSEFVRHLTDNFTTEEGRITPDKISDEDGNLTKDGRIVLDNISGLSNGIFSNPALAKMFLGRSATRLLSDGTEQAVPLSTILREIETFSANPKLGKLDEPTEEEKEYYADIASLRKVLDDINDKVNPTEEDNQLGTVISKILNPQTLSTVDTNKLKAVEENKDQGKEYIPLWKRVANQSLGVPIQLLANNRSNTGDLYEKIRTRSQAGQVATAMLQSGSPFSRVADMMAYTGVSNSKINGGASSTAQVDWQRTSANIRDFALSLSSATDVTSAYVSSLTEQQSQVYSILTGWKSMEDFDKMTDEKLKDNLGQIKETTRNTVTAYQSTFGYSASAADLDRNVVDTLYQIEHTNGKERRVYLDKLTQQMSVLSEMLKEQRKTAETALAIKNSIKNISQQEEASQDEIFLNTVSAVGSGVRELSGLTPQAEAILWKSLLDSVNSQQSLVQIYDTNKSGRLSYSELKENLPDILKELRGIEKNVSGAADSAGKIAARPIDKAPLGSVNDMAGGNSLAGIAEDGQAGELIKAVRSGADRGSLNKLYNQTSFSARKWGKYAKDNGLTLEQAMSVAKDSSSDLPHIRKGFGEADGSMRISSDSVTVQAKEAAVQGQDKGYLESMMDSSVRADAAAGTAKVSNMYRDADSKLTEEGRKKDMSLDRWQSVMHAFDIPFVMPALNARFGGKDGTRLQPYTDSAGDIMTKAGANTRRQQMALNYLDSAGFTGAGGMSMDSFVNDSVKLWGSGAGFNQENFDAGRKALLEAANDAGIKDAADRLDGIGMFLGNGSEDSIKLAREELAGLVEDMADADFTSYLDSQLKSLSQTMKETFSSNMLSGVSDSFVQIGKNLRDGESASRGMYSIWKNIGREITGTIGATMTSTGLQIAGAAAADPKGPNWGKVAAGLAMAASGGICSIASGLLSDSDSSDSSSEDDGREQRIQNLKDALSDLIDQAKTDAEYYERNLLHKNALSANEAVSTRSVNDAIITPSGDIVTTHPDDYLIATKTPGSLVGAGKTSVTLQVNPVVINQSSAGVTAKTEARENSDGSVDIMTTIVDVMNMALATGKMDEGMAAYEANRNGRSVVY